MRWFVLSAEYGVVEPDQVIEPYDRSLADISIAARRSWSAKVLKHLTETLGDLRAYRFEIHAGANYFAYGVADGLRAAGAAVSIPTEGLRQGEQLQYYGRAETSATEPGVEDPTGDQPIQAKATGGRWGRLADLLDVRGGTHVRLTFDEMSDFIGTPLPSSARTYAAWWHSQSWVRYWHSRGWRATPKFREAAVVFIRMPVED
jgi:hypothetical protein